MLILLILELMQLIGDHYVGEAQTLTTGAEENLLKLAMLRGVITEQDQARWEHICKTYSSKQQLQVEGDPTVQAVQQLTSMANAREVIKQDMLQSDTSDLIRPINRVAAAIKMLSDTWEGGSKE